MGTYVVLNDRETFSDLAGCLILFATDAQEERYEEDLENGDIRPLVDDPDVERVELNLDFVRKLLPSSPPESGAGPRTTS